MSDFLLELSPRTRQIIKSLGLPLPMPQVLRLSVSMPHATVNRSRSRR